MASPPITYSKKKGLSRLAVFGSFRKGRRVKAGQSAAISHKTSPDAVAINAHLANPGQAGVDESKTRDNIIEELASALLEDTPSSMLRRGDRRPTRRSALQPSYSMPADHQPAPRLPDIEVSPLARHPIFVASDVRSPASSSQTLPEPARPTRVAYDPPMPAPRPSNRQSGLPRGGLGVDRQDLAPPRRLPQSKTAIVADRRDSDAGLPPSKSVPFPPFVDQIALQAAREYDISQKVSAMLAATESLKPSSTRPANPGPSRIQRMISSSNLLTKVSTALDRLNYKGGIKESKIRGQISQPLALRHGTIRVAAQSHESLVSFNEMRRNESDNLSKDKVRQMFGAGHVHRKPVANATKSGLSISSDDPFSSSPSASRTYTQFEQRLKTHSDNHDVYADVSNPFDTEDSFDGDLNGVLRTSPVASSTPRIRLHRATSLPESPTKQGRPSGLRGGGSYMQQDSDLGCTATCSRTARKDMGRRATLIADGFIDLGLCGKGDERTQMSPAMKKHPSPSKESLESLGREFRHYAELQLANAKKEDNDELAMSFSRLTRTAILGIRDSNGKVRAQHRAIKGHTAMEGFPGPNRGSALLLPAAPRGSRIPRSTSRLVPLRYPENGSMEVDELQWSDATYQVGRRA